jgi:hypothetical protein
LDEGQPGAGQSSDGIYCSDPGRPHPTKSRGRSQPKWDEHATAEEEERRCAQWMGSLVEGKASRSAATYDWWRNAARRSRGRATAPLGSVTNQTQAVEVEVAGLQWLGAPGARR